MPPFAGDIGARAGSLKWTAQIPRKAYRWALRGDLKNCFLALNVGDQELEELFLMSSQNTNSESSSVSSRMPENQAKRRSSSGVVFNFVDLRSRILSLDGAVSTKNCESGFGQLVIAHARSAKVGLCKTAPAKNGSIFL